MAQYDATALDAALKEFYDKDTVHDTVYEDNPWFGMLSKEQTGGEYYVLPIQYEIPGSRSHDIQKVLANKKVSKYLKFNIETIEDYAAISIGRKVMKQTTKNEYAFFEAQQREVDKMLKSLVRSLAQGLYRNKGAARGQISSGSNVATDTITLADVEEVANFGVGDVLVASANDGSSSAHTLISGSNTLESVNRDDGTLTCVAATWATGIAGIAASYYLFKDGDFGEGISGFDGWCPTTAPSSGDNFHGADRSPDATRLAGVRVNGDGLPITEAIQRGCSRLGREGAMPDTVLMSHAKLRDLIIELGNRVQYSVTKAEDATVGFQGVEFVSTKGKVTCFADHNCPNKRMYITKKSVWKLIYNGDDVPEIQDEDGSMLCREQGSDGFEVRASYYANAACTEPNQNCVVTFTS